MAGLLPKVPTLPEASFIASARPLRRLYAFPMVHALLVETRCRVNSAHDALH